MARRTPRPKPTLPGLFDEPASTEPEAEPERGEASAPPPRAPDRAAVPAKDPVQRLSVSELTAAIGSQLASLGRVSVEGELSGLKRYASGHVYFDLKDDRARISCVVWRSRVDRALRFEPEDGMQLVAHGKLDVYGPRGSYSLIVDRVEAQGVGALLARLEQLKAELGALGWFERRRPLPSMPRRIGVVTSRDGAALRDFLRTRTLRWPAYPVRLSHTPVQGPGAALEIAEAIERLDRSGVDVIVLCRGGGSLEDLWAFNEREVAQAVWNASVPVVCGVGHETDTTLADFVADHRAHTPTDAASAVIPDRAALVEELARLGNYLIEAVDQIVAGRGERLSGFARRPVLRSADWILGHRAKALASHAALLHKSARERVLGASSRAAALQIRLERLSPSARLERQRADLEAKGVRLVSIAARRMEESESRLERAASGLEAISPLAVLGRGYSLTSRRGEGAPLLRAADVRPGDELETRLAEGSLVSRVEETRLVDRPGDRPDDRTPDASESP